MPLSTKTAVEEKNNMSLLKKQVGEIVYFYDPNILVPHAFTTRCGGVSGGVYESLNLGLNLGDHQADVYENYHRILGALGTNSKKLIVQRQIHTDVVRQVGKADLLDGVFHGDLPQGDGLITTEKGISLGVFTADCIPILLWDEKTGAIGVVHAGWRSTVMNIAGKAVEKLVETAQTEVRHIRVAIGPGIGFCCFETDEEVPKAVEAALGENSHGSILRKEQGKAMVDLKEVNRRLLVGAGVLAHNITLSELCTMCHPELFWSHRKMGRERGSLASIICAKE